MTVEHINHRTSQIGLLSTLEHMIAQGGLRGYLEEFILSCRADELSPATLADYRQKIGAFVNFCDTISKNEPNQITSSHIRLFLIGLQERCNPHSVHDYYGCVKRFFNWLVSEGVLKANPMASMRSPRIPKKIIRPFSADHIRDMLLLCDEKTFLGVRNRAIILMFLDTGLRLSEMTNIQINDIDFENGRIKVMGKGAKERVVGIGRGAQKALLKYLLVSRDNQMKRNGRLLSCLWVTEEMRPMRFRGIQIMIRRLGKRMGIYNVRCSPHTFRHTFGTRALLNGASEREVQLLLGHSTQRMTQQYTATITSENVVVRHSQFSPVDNMDLKHH